VVLVSHQFIHKHDVYCDIIFVSSDQSDPFNRQPLSMEMVEPAIELKQKIDAWIQEQRDKRAAKSS